MASVFETIEPLFDMSGHISPVQAAQSKQTWNERAESKRVNKKQQQRESQGEMYKNDRKQTTAYHHSHINCK